MASCLSAPILPGTWTARPRCVPPPTAVPGEFACPIGPASARRCGGYGDGIRMRQRSCGLWDCDTLCLSTGSGLFTPETAEFQTWIRGGPRLCSPKSAATASCRGRWLRLPPRSGIRLPRRPGRSSWSPLCPGPWGWVQWRPPKRAWPMEQSADCHSQVTPRNSSHSSIKTAHMRSSAPHSTHRWKVRWIVLSSPNSLGRWFYRQPLRIR